jgi:ADP-ribosyl-[dinitrogen reductase] hydrolase
MNTLARMKGSLLGLACGDAVGTTVEFSPPGSFTPVIDMIGGGPFGLKAGQWTDDTTMALCLATSLVERATFDPDDQMQHYVRWKDDGYLSVTGHCFDIGTTVRIALNHYQRTGEPYSGSQDPNTAGNGSLMRLAPVPMFYYPDLAQVIHFAALSSRTTHGAPEAVDACRLFALLLHRAFSGVDRQTLLFAPVELPAGEPALAPKIADIAQGGYRTKFESEIRGIGYAVASLEAALWCFYKTDSFEAAIIRAANLGNDADTTAAICGQLAGAYYGVDAIPDHWLARLAMRAEIEDLATRLCRHAD